MRLVAAVTLIAVYLFGILVGTLSTFGWLPLWVTGVIAGGVGGGSIWLTRRYLP